MKVKDLIVKLSMLDPELEVMLDKTSETMEVFKFESLIEADEVEVEDGSKFVGLFTREYEGDSHNLN